MYRNDYSILTDKNTGKTIALNKRTGEVSDTTNPILPVGTICYTPNQQQDYNKRKEKEKYQYRYLKELGTFYFLLVDKQLGDMHPQNIARLVYLLTYMCYSDNVLRSSRDKPIYKNDLSNVLNVSKATAYRFWNEVSPKFICESDGLIVANDDYFKRGKLKRKQFVQYQKMHIKSIQSLYKSVDQKYHKQLGYIFKLIPFINFEYNLVCRPDCVWETDLDKIELISIADFCDLINYDVTQWFKLVQDYTSISFKVDSHDENFCRLIYDGINNRSAKICINPKIFYNGSDYKNVEILTAFYK